MKLISQRAAHKLQAEIVRIQAEHEDRCLVLEKAERELAKLKSYIDQEKFNWLLDRERANGAEAEISEYKEIIRLKNNLIFRLVARAEKAEREFAELRDAVAWYFETRGRQAEFISKNTYRQVRDVRLAMREVKKIQDHAEQQLRSLIGDE